MKLASAVKGFLKMTGHYADSAVYLAEHGYNDKYMEMLSAEVQTAKGRKEKAEGMGLTAQALMFRGELEAALKAYDETDIEGLPRHMNSVFVNNYILCLFLMQKYSRAMEIYEKYNSIALSEGTLVMRRTIGIREYIEKRFENAVTVFIKLVEEPDPRATLMADICLVKAMLSLDMKERAKEIADLGFQRYTGRGDITAIVNKLNMRINKREKPHKPKKRRK